MRKSRSSSGESCRLLEMVLVFVAERLYGLNTACTRSAVWHGDVAMSFRVVASVALYDSLYVVRSGPVDRDAGQGLRAFRWSDSPPKGI